MTIRIDDTLDESQGVEEKYQGTQVMIEIGIVWRLWQMHSSSEGRYAKQSTYFWNTSLNVAGRTTGYHYIILSSMTCMVASTTIHSIYFLYMSFSLSLVGQVVVFGMLIALSCLWSCSGDFWCLALCVWVFYSLWTFVVHTHKVVSTLMHVSSWSSKRSSQVSTCHSQL